MVFSFLVEFLSFVYFLTTLTTISYPAASAVEVS